MERKAQEKCFKCGKMVEIDVLLKKQIVGCSCGNYMEITHTASTRAKKNLENNLRAGAAKLLAEEEKKITPKKIEQAVKERIKTIGLEKEYPCVNVMDYHKEVRIEFTKDIEKYVDYRKYNFLTKEYDNNIFVTPYEEMDASTKKTYKAFLEKHEQKFLKIKPGIKSVTEAGVGDKDYLMVSTIYEIPYKEYSEKEIKRIIGLIEKN